MTQKYPFGLKDLSGCSDLSDVATILIEKPKFLSFSIYKTADDVKYTAFLIEKKSGKKREIFAPNPGLKSIQSRLSRLLYQCYFELYGKPKNHGRVLSHGFQRKRELSIFTNAARHKNRRYVFNVDLEDFFPSLNFGRVRGFFIKHNKFQLGEKAATAIAQLSCFRGSLPQGAPSSPIISEFLAQPLDIALQKLAKKYRCTYSRYVDDITFSTNLREFPDAIARPTENPKIWNAGPDLEREITRCGFKLNSAKTRMQTYTHWQSVNNLTVNKGVNIRKHYYKGARFCAHAMMTTGKAYAGDKLSIARNDLNSEQIWGKLSHICNIKNKSKAIKPLHQYTNAEKAPHYLRLAGDYFHYHRIYISPKPLIICEGKTDYIYLKEAIHWNKNDKRVAANLIDVSKGGKTNGNHWRVGFVRYSKAAERFLGLAGGTANLIKFCNNHIDRVKKYHDPAERKPVIIIIDNDSGANGMWRFIENKTNPPKNNVDGSEPFYKIGNDLYVVPIPKAKDSNDEMYIEMLFPTEWRKKEHEGKTLNLNQKKGEKLKEKEYGKVTFATKVIRPNRDKVNCRQFLPLLHTVCDIIEAKTPAPNTDSGT